MKRDKHITLLGKRYALRRAPYLGQYRGDCDPPDVPNKKIRVLMGLSGEEELEVTLHEMLHACDWEKSEQWVNDTAMDIARVLHRLGYRKIEKEK